MFDWLGDQFEFCVVTRDRDLGDTEPYSNRQAGRWYPIQGGQVQYLRATYQLPQTFRALVQECQADLLYINSALDPMLAICPLVLRRLGYLRTVPPIVVAPRGEFSPGALEIKRAKKAAYLQAAKPLGVYGHVTWHATSIPELDDIRARWGGVARVVLAPNIPPRNTLSRVVRRTPKRAGQLRLIFLSRISRKKNLLGALRILQGVAGTVIFDIYGSLEDPGYWAECEKVLIDLPANIVVTYKGAIAPDAVMPTLSGYDVFLLPTLGENFGHAILEALLAGCPVILSDRTPWRGLVEKRAGFDLEVDQIQEFRFALESFVAMDSGEFSLWSDNARLCGEAYCAKSGLVDSTRDLFEEAISRRWGGN